MTEAIVTVAGGGGGGGGGAGRGVAMFNLLRAGYETVSAESGSEALSLFFRGDFDLVITDVRMPGLSGIELLRRIRKMAPDLPAIVITAFGDMETAMEAR